MDCEKFESSMIDELYGELDELTSASVKRHVAGCARCASLFGGLRATRRVAVLPLAEPTSDLEDRILEAARHAQKVVPLRTRIARGVSTAGSWAMRPQTAMAALFLLMIGSSVLLLRGRHAKSPASATVTVSELGAPAPAASALSPADRDDVVAAANAHGAKPSIARSSRGGDLMEAKEDRPGRDGAHLKASTSPVDDALDKQRAQVANAGPIAGTGYGSGLPPGESLPPPNASPNAATPTAYAGGQQGLGGSFSSAQSDYAAGRYARAYGGFSTLAANDPNAALMAARSKQGMSGCGAAVREYDDLAQRAAGTNVGFEATLEGGRCYRLIGAFDAARERLGRLLGVGSYGQQAQQELDLIDGAIASRRATTQPAATATAAASATAAGAPPTAAP